MGILIDGNTRVICQGLTGATATRLTERAIAYGTRMVGGVVPGKGGQTHLHLPVLETVAEAVNATQPDASAVFVPPMSAAAAIIEAIEQAMADGATPTDLGRALAYAAALRIARFGSVEIPLQGFAIGAAVEVLAGEYGNRHGKYTQK